MKGKVMGFTDEEFYEFVSRALSVDVPDRHDLRTLILFAVLKKVGEIGENLDENFNSLLSTVDNIEESSKDISDQMDNIISELENLKEVVLAK